MTVQDHRQHLLDLEAQLATRTTRARDEARALVRDEPGDTGDASVADEGQSEDFTKAGLDATVLQQVRDALHRIDQGTFGRCVVDGEPIEAKRLDAVPWTPYCLKHQTELEATEQSTTPTL